MAFSLFHSNFITFTLYGMILSFTFIGQHYGIETPFAHAERISFLVSFSIVSLLLPLPRRLCFRLV